MVLPFQIKKVFLEENKKILFQKKENFNKDQYRASLSGSFRRLNEE